MHVQYLMIFTWLNSKRLKFSCRFIRHTTACLGTLLITSTAFASEKSCASIFLDKRHSELSEGQLNAWAGYSTEGMKTIERQWFILPTGGPFPQRILFPESLDVRQRETVKQLEDMRFDVQLNEAQIRSYWETTGQDPAQPLPPTTEKWRIRPAIEVAALRFIGKDGRTAEKHFTSKMFDLIKIEDFNQAFDELSQLLKISEVERIEFFHTHPTRYRFQQPLSEGDGKTAEKFVKSLAENYGASRPSFSMYAVHLTSDGDTVLFNSLH